MWLLTWDFEKHEETKTNPSDVWGGKIWFWGGNWDERLTKRKGYVKNYGEVNKKWEWFEENHTNSNPRGRGKAYPTKKWRHFRPLIKRVARHWERVKWGWRKGKEELYFSFGSREGASKENGGSKQESKGNGFVVCSPERMTVTHAHADTVTGTGFEILFYECMVGFVYRESPSSKETHPNKTNKTQFHLSSLCESCEMKTSEKTI